MSLFIGLMSGTSADAIDAAIIDTSCSPIKVIACATYPMEPKLRTDILALYEPGGNEIDRVGDIDNRLAHVFAEAVITLTNHHQIKRSEITAIGSHGQTIRHRPTTAHGGPFTLQIGNPSVIAQETGICTIADFRRRDMACGGQGAPLTPAFHDFVFASKTRNRAILNIGGIANLTCLPINGVITGFDTGPGNGLMDAWINEHKGMSYDRQGVWAQTGQCSAALLQALMDTPFIKQTPPKSTGREAFCLTWLKSEFSEQLNIPPEDVQATLLEFTARSICLHIHSHCPKDVDVYICGGGVYNTALMSLLNRLMPSTLFDSTMALGINPNDVEAITFAWLAMRTWQGMHGNMPSVTGASHSVILGGIYPA